MRVLVFICFLILPFLMTEKLVVWVDDFEMKDVDGLPDKWNGRTKSASNFYQLAVQDSNQFLHVHSKNSDDFILKKIKVDIVKYPYLNWSWRVHQLPPNGNESVKKFCDVAASVNLVINASKLIPKSIKYSWSTTLDKETVSKSPYAFWPARTDIIVIESGESKLGQWKQVKRNVLKDYQKFYKKKKLKSCIIEAIVIMTDSDNTRSESIADYDNIFFSAN